MAFRGLRTGARGSSAVSSSSSSSIRAARQRLAQLGAVAVQGVGFQAEAPGQHVGLAAFLDGGAVRHVDGLGDRARDEGLCCCHHGDVAVDRQEPLADAAAGIGAVKDRQMLVLHVRRAFQRHRAADMHVGGLDGVLLEAKRFEHVEAEIIQLIVSEAERVLAELIAKGPAVEGELHVKGAFHGRFDLVDLGIAEALVTKRTKRDGLAVFQAACTDGVIDDVVNLLLRVAKLGKRLGNNAVDDLEVAATGKLLELHDRKVWLDAGGVAIHHQADGAGRGHHGGLGVAVAVLAAQFERLVPGGLGGVDQLRVRAGRCVKRHRQNAQPLVALVLAMCGEAMVLHHPHHVLGVLLV